MTSGSNFPVGTSDAVFATACRPPEVVRIEACAETLAGTLGTAEALLRAHRRLDLQGLERQVEILCAGVLALPADQARPFVRPLQSLVARVAGVIAALGAAA